MADTAQSLILVANPGSASRKYALYDSALTERAQLHFEHVGAGIRATLHRGDESHDIPVSFSDIAEAGRHIDAILRDQNIVQEGETIDRIGLRVVAPSAYFMKDHIINDDVVTKLEEVSSLAPLHISATLNELKLLRDSNQTAQIVGVSDSAFHAAKPNYAWNYGINIQDADRLDIKRFGYHGLSVSSAIEALWDAGKLPPKVIVCHLGSGSSITGVFHGRSIDTTMGFTPLDGVIMATRSGSIDPGAVRALQHGLDLDEEGVEAYLNNNSGLLGLGGSNDIRELIQREVDGDHAAHLALTTLIHTIHKAIGSMLVAMNGCDLLVFTGTVGERSANLRKRIVAHLEFTDFILDGELNNACTNPDRMTALNQKGKSRPIFVIPANESREIAKHVLSATKDVQ